MELTQEIVDEFVGGQLEVQNQVEGYVYRGEIASVTIGSEGDMRHLSVSFNWFAQLGSDLKWSVVSLDPYNVGLLMYEVTPIGDGRICLNLAITGETVIFFPPGGSKLDPAKVRGLVLTA